MEASVDSFAQSMAVRDAAFMQLTETENAAHLLGYRIDGTGTLFRVP